MSLQDSILLLAYLFELLQCNNQTPQNNLQNFNTFLCGHYYIPQRSVSQKVVSEKLVVSCDETIQMSIVTS